MTKNTILIKKITGWVSLFALMVMVIFVPSILAPTRTSAATVDYSASHCLSQTRYSGIESVQNACNACTTNKSINHGAAWLSNSAGGRKAVSTFTYTGDSGMTLSELKGKTIKTNIYGMAYSCGHANPANRQIKAYYVWFGKKGDAGKAAGSDARMESYIRNNAYNFITIAGAAPGSSTSTFERGVARGVMATWSTLGSVKVQIKLNDDFFKAAKCTTSTETPKGSDKTIEITECKLEVSVNRCFNSAAMVGSGKDRYTMPGIGIGPGNGCGGEDSTINIVLETNPEDDCNEDTPYDENNPNCFCKYHPDDSKCKVELKGNISTTSKVKIAEQGETYHDIHEEELQSTDNGTATIKLSTKEEEVEVEFEHRLKYSASVDTDAFAASQGLYPEQLTTGYGVVQSEEGPNPSYALSKETIQANQDAVKNFSIPIVICQSDEDTDADDHCGSQVYSTNLFPFAGRLGTSLTKDAKGGYTDDGSRAFSSGSVVPPDWDLEKDAEGNPVVITKVKVKTKPGERVKICQKIKGKPKEFLYEGTLYDQEVLKDGSYIIAPSQEYTVKERNSKGEVIKVDGVEQTKKLFLTPKYFLITGIKNDESSGSAWSKACAVIYRPTEPDVPVGDDNPGAVSTSTADSSIMYAGESAGLKWDGKANNINTLRIKAAQSIVALVPVDNEWTGKAMTEGTYWYKANEGGAKRDVCTFFAAGEKLKVPEKYTNAQFGGCKEVEYDEWETGGAEAKKFVEKEYGHALSLSVPDNVGYKVCNSMGWRYEHWVGKVKKEESERGLTESELPKGRVEWKSYPEDDYWTVYNAKCRTIAKKPSTAIWNGSFMTGGGVKTSLSGRINFTDGIFGQSFDDSTKKLYGSWVEYLGIVNGKYYGLGTGGSLWKSGLQGGSKIDKLCNKTNTLFGNTPLTVSNFQTTGGNGFKNGLACYALGNANVSQDSVYLGRLQSFLLEQSSRGNMNLITSNTISGNVNAVSGGPLATMKQNVVYVPSGDLTITGDVTEINAWVVVPNGKIKTCDTWQDKVTEAAVRSMSGALYQASNMKCQNQLTFNGPVYAGGGVELRRTYGSDALMPKDLPGQIPVSGDDGRNRSAEIFNLSADTYLWAFSQGQSYNSSFTDAYVRELAPRY